MTAQVLHPLAELTTDRSPPGLSGDAPVKERADWELIEKLYRAGLLSLREIAKQAGGAVSESAIRKRASRDGWARDLSARITARADELVRKAVVRKEGAQLSPVSEAQIVEANADLQKRVQIQHRQDVGRTVRLFEALLAELELLTGHPVQFADLGALMDESGPNASGTWVKDKSNELYRKITSLGGRVDNAKKLTETLEKLIKLEREAFGITAGEEASNPLDELLKKIKREREGAR